MRLGLLLLVALLAWGCAKLPEGGTGARTRRLILSMTLDGEVNENFVYIFPLRVTTEENPTTQGPIPVIAPPWGNGFVAGNATHFVRWEPFRPRPFVLYRFNDPALLNFTEIGIIENYVEIPPDNPNIDNEQLRRTLRFELEIEDLAASAAQAEELRTVQLNFLTMERIGSGNQGRAWDALGNGALPSEINQFISIPLRTADRYDNQRFNNLEPARDVVDPSLDIVDWFVEVRLQ